MLSPAALFACAVLALCLFASSSAAQCSLPVFTKFDPTKYTLSASQHGDRAPACVYWKVTGTSLAVAVAAPTKGWVGFGVLRNSSWDSADMVIGWVDDTGVAHIHDYIKHFSQHTVPETYANSPILDTNFGGTDINGTTNVEEKNGWTVMEFVRDMSSNDNLADSALLTYNTQYQRVAWAYDSLDPSTINSIPEHIAHGLVNIDFQLGGATVPDIPLDIWVTNVGPTSFTINWNTPTLNQAGAAGLSTLNYWQVSLTHIGSAGANCLSGQIDYENHQCFGYCPACVAAPTATSLTITNAMYQQHCDTSGLSGLCGPGSVQPNYWSIAEGIRYFFMVAGVNTRGQRTSYSPMFSVRTTQTTSPTTTVPGLPRNLRLASRTSTDLTVTWDAPNDDGGAAITDYEVICDAGLGFAAPYSEYINKTTGTGSVTTMTYNNLVPYGESLTLRFRVRAKNSNGWGLFTSDRDGDRSAYAVWTVYPLPGAPAGAPVVAAPPTAAAAAPVAAQCPDGCVHGTCIAQDTCQCDNGWSGGACTTPTGAPGASSAPKNAPTTSAPTNAQVNVVPVASNNAQAQTTACGAFILLALSAILYM